MPFGFHRDHQSRPAEVEWFRSFAEIPGIEWVSPVDVAIDPNLGAAHPVAVDPDDTWEGGPTFRWVDGAGQPVGGPYGYRDSPVAVVTEGLYDEPPARQLKLSLTSLAYPGTRYDYAQALSAAERAVQSEGVARFDVLDVVLQGHIGLMLAGPREALAAPWSDYEIPMERASDPFIALMTLYQREGFLLEAAGIERLLETLPADAQSRYVPEPRPSEVLAGLRALR